MTEKSALKGFLGYVVPFFVIFVGLYVLYKWQEPHLFSYYSALAESVCATLAPFDPAVTCQDNVLSYDGVQSLIIVEGCDGVTFVVLILAAVLPFPSRLREKLIGLPVLILALLGFNWLRLVILGAVRFYLPDQFALFHVYLFQPIMIVFTIAIFIAWITYSDRKSNAH